MTVTSPRRARLLAGATLLLTPLLVLTTPAIADAAPTRDRADAAAGWLGRQLDADTHLVTGQFGPDYGLTADVVLALDAAGIGRMQAQRTTAALKRNVLAYTGGGDRAEFYAGSFAKLVVVAEAQGVPARQFGRSARSNLLANLRSLECGTPRRTNCSEVDLGRFSDRSQFGDFSNAITQSLALIALERATSAGPSAASVRYLRTQQCTNGSFPLTFGATKCVGSSDATGFAVQALVSVGSATARAAAQDAGRWLRRRQNEDGSLSGNGSDNANSSAGRRARSAATGNAGVDAGVDAAVDGSASDGGVGAAVEDARSNCLPGCTETRGDAALSVVTHCVARGPGSGEFGASDNAVPIGADRVADLLANVAGPEELGPTKVADFIRIARQIERGLKPYSLAFEGDSARLQLDTLRAQQANVREARAGEPGRRSDGSGENGVFSVAPVSAELERKAAAECSGVESDLDLLTALRLEVGVAERVRGDA